jgi:pyocin large subunit-like protein
MNHEAIAWALAAPISPSSAKFLLVALAYYANEEGTCFPSVACLSMATSQDRKTVIQNLQRLIIAGYITDTGNRVGGTGQVVVYKLIKKDDNSTENGTVTPPKLSTNDTVLGTVCKDNNTENGTVNDDLTIPKTGLFGKNATNNSTENGTLSALTVPKTVLLETQTVPKTVHGSINILYKTKGGGVNKRGKNDNSQETHTPTRIMKNWQLPKKWGDWAMSQNKQWTDDHVRSVAENFLDHYVAEPGDKGVSADWESTWHKWVRRECVFEQQREQKKEAKLGKKLSADRFELPASVAMAKPPVTAAAKEKLQEAKELLKKKNKILGV